MKKINPYLNRIARLTGDQDTIQALQKFVSRHVDENSSLDAAARKLGVQEIVEERLPFEGGLFKAPDGKLLIKLNSESSPVRKRFTLAHEIGHLLLGTVPGFRGTCLSDDALERTCDKIAAELLMPCDRAAGYARNLGAPSPEKLRLVASEYAVSLQMAAIRLHYDLRVWKCCIGYWEAKPQAKVRWFVGQRRWDTVEPDPYSLDLALSCTGSVKSQELWRRGPSTAPVWLHLLRVAENRVLGLVNFVN
jgi:hypothetical protein